MSDEEDYKDLPSVEIGGLKFVDATGENLPPDMMKIFIEALIESGQISRAADGTLTANNAEEGKVRGIEFNVTDGEVTEAHQLDEDEIPHELRQRH